MKNILLRLICISACCCLPVRSYARDVVSLDTPRDSLLEVIGYFEKGEKLEYVVRAHQWKVRGNDTTKTYGVSYKARLEVKDSTAKGYKMDYTFLSFESDTTVTDPTGIFQNRIMDMYGPRIAETTLQFETDEFGAITGFTNLKQIQKQARKVLTDVLLEIFALPEIKAIMPGMKNPKKFIREYLADEDLVEGYTEELKLLFGYHGEAYRVGESSEHHDATDTDYAYDSYIDISQDPDEWSYKIRSSVTSIIPKKDAESWISSLMNIYCDENVTEEFIRQFDNRVDSDCTYTDYLRISYYVDGWPSSLLQQQTTRIADAESIRQIAISLVAYSR